jgi:hypothetical protein
VKTNKVNLFVSFVLFVFWYHSLNFLDTPRIMYCVTLGHAGKVVEALCYKPESRGIDSQWCQWNFSLTILPAALWSWG